MIPKYRAYNKKRKTIADVLGWQLYGSINNEPLICCSVLEDTNTHIYEPMSEFELMQWTGLVDNNKVEIYRLDIAKVTHRDSGIVTIHVVQWGGAYPAFYLSPVLSEDTNDFSFIFGSGEYDIEVIGNYLLNPELLEGAERE